MKFNIDSNATAGCADTKPYTLNTLSYLALKSVMIYKKYANTTECLMWIPHLTVATVIENDGRFLMVEEISGGQRVINQPAGHVEDGESIFEAAIRETLEETCYEIKLDSFLGISRFIAPNGDTYFRHSFAGTVIKQRKDVVRDNDIKDVLWLSMDEIEKNKARHRSMMVQRDLERYTNGQHFPLDIYSD